MDIVAHHVAFSKVRQTKLPAAFALILILVVFGAVCLAPTARAAGTKASTGPCAALRTRADRVMKRWIGRGKGRAGKTVGAEVGVYIAGNECYLGYGKVRVGGHAPTAKTVFEIGSVTKTFTATMLALREVRDSAFSAKNPVDTSKIPCAGSHCLHLSKGMQKLTYQELATFTGGLPDDPTNLHGVSKRRYTQADFIEFLNGLSAPKSGLPAKNFYSNSSYGFLGQLLMSFDGYRDFDKPDAFRNSFDQWISREITGPLGMTCTVADTAALPSACAAKTATGYRFAHGRFVAVDKPWPWIPWGPAGALRSNAQDLLRYVQAYLGVAKVDGKAVPNELTRAMARARAPTDVRMRKRGNRQAYAWVVHAAQNPRKALVNKNGGTAGFSACVAMMPGRKVGIVLLANTSKSHSCLYAMKILRGLPR